jgi:4-amino-4-deoxy-L-arabinose transferase-like glycosyltransferase
MQVPRLLVHALVAAALLRCVALGAHSLWLDEGATWSWATADTWSQTVLAEANHPPAWWVITRLWIGAFGDDPASLRWPAALVGVLTVLLAWRLAQRLLQPDRQPRRGGFGPPPGDVPPSSRTALLFAGFIAVSPYLTEYAQEARMYALLVAEALGLTLLYLGWLDDGRRRWLVGYALLGALALHTHYFALWPLLAHPVHALLLARRRRGTGTPLQALPLLAATAVAGLLFVPWFLHLVANYRSISTGEAYDPFSRLGYVIWRMGVGPGLIVVDRTRQQAGLGAVLADEAPFAVLTTLLWVPALVFGAAALWRRPGTRSIVLANLLVPIVCVLAAHLAGFQLIHERYLVFLGPWVLLVALLGAREAGPRWRPGLLLSLGLLLVAGNVAYHGASLALAPMGHAGFLGREAIPATFGADPADPLTVLHHGHPYGKEPWRQAQRFAAARTDPARGDVVILYPRYLELVWDAYDRGRLPKVLLPAGDDPATWQVALEDAADLLAGARRIVLVLAHEETRDPDAAFAFVRNHLARQSVAAGSGRMQVAGPTLFDRSWGVRLAFFDRRGDDDR